MARTFARAGARLALADIAPMGTVATEVEALGAEVLAIPTDVTNETQARSLMHQAHRRWGRIDVLINNAGIVTHFHTGAPRWPRIRDMERSFFQKVMDTNLTGTFLCTKHVLPYMESLNDGHIINFGQGTLSAHRPAASPNIGSCVYNTSKLSIRAFTQSVAEEEREFNVCIVSMGPGGTLNGVEAPREWGPGIAGAGGGIVTEDSPEWARQGNRGTRVDDIGDRYVRAAEAPIELSGHQLIVRDGTLAIFPD